MNWLDEKVVKGAIVGVISLGVFAVIAFSVVSLFGFWSQGSVDRADVDGAIFVSHPVVFSRGRLLNESIAEERSLQNEIQTADSYTGTIGREVVSTETGRVAIDLGAADKAPGQESQTQSVPSAGQTQTPDLLLALKDREAIRSHINDVLAANSIYDSQRLDQLGLYRIQFSVSLLPRAPVPAVAYILVKFQAPSVGKSEADRADLISLYTYLLARDSIRATRSQDLIANPVMARLPAKHSAKRRATAKASPEQKEPQSSPQLRPLSELPNEEILPRRFFTEQPVKVPTNDDAGTSCNTTRPNLALVLFDLFGPAPGRPNVASPTKDDTRACTKLVLALPTQDPTLAQTIVNGMVSGLSDSIRQLYPAWHQFRESLDKKELPRQLDVFVRLPANCDFLKWSSSDENEAFRKVALQLSPTIAPYLSDPRPAFAEAIAANTFQPLIDVILERMASSGQLSREERDAAKRLAEKDDAYFHEAAELADVVRTAPVNLGSKCAISPVSQQFQNAITRSVRPNHLELNGTAETLRLLPTFRSVFESNTSAVDTRVEDRTSTPVGTGGASRGHNARDTSIVSQASVVSFSDERGQISGWVLNPDQSDEGSPGRWVQRARNEYLSADVALPAWWPKVVIVVTEYWREGRSGREIGERESLTFNVDLPGARQDGESVARYLLRGAIFDSGAPPTLQSPDGTDQLKISACRGDDAVLIVQGANLWHSPRVFVGTAEGTDVAVMPDLSGITAKIKAPATSTEGPLPVYVVTSTAGLRQAGTVTFSSPVSCSVAKPPDGGAQHG